MGRLDWVSYGIAIHNDYRRYFEGRTMTQQSEIETVLLFDTENREEVVLYFVRRSRSAES